VVDPSTGGDLNAIDAVHGRGAYHRPVLALEDALTYVSDAYVWALKPRYTSGPIDLGEDSQCCPPLSATPCGWS
jgi:hypothetical protein